MKFIENVEEDRYELYLTEEEYNDEGPYLDSYQLRTFGLDKKFEYLGEFLSDPDESFYQGQLMIHVIKKISNGRLYGIQFWQGGGKYGEPFINEDQVDYDDENENEIIYYRPVKEFTIKGYEYA